MKILVTGATGLVGPSIVHAFRAADRDVRAVVRRPDRAGSLTALGVEVVAGDVTDAESLKRRRRGMHSRRAPGRDHPGRPDDFKRVMTVGTQNVVAAAKEAGVQRFVLMSALGTSDPPSVPYYAAKLAEERELLASGLEHTIFRPSFVFGRGGALATFMRQVRLSPVVDRRRLRAVSVRSRSGATTSRNVLRTGDRRSPRGEPACSSSAGPTPSTGTSSTCRSRRCSASGGA